MRRAVIHAPRFAPLRRSIARLLLAAGLSQVMDYLSTLRFTPDDIAWLAQTDRFSPGLLRYLERLRFSGSVDAMPEGTIFFPHEPVLRITAPLALAQLVETRVTNLLHYPTLVASKAVRCVLAAQGRSLTDLGLRRAHGAEAAIHAARACYLAGFSATSDAVAAQQYGIPAAGTGSALTRGFRQLVGDGHEELAEEERRRGRGDERQRQAHVRVEDAQVGGDLEELGELGVVGEAFAQRGHGAAHVLDRGGPGRGGPPRHVPVPSDAHRHPDGPQAQVGPGP